MVSRKITIENVDDDDYYAVNDHEDHSSHKNIDLAMVLAHTSSYDDFLEDKDSCDL